MRPLQMIPPYLAPIALLVSFGCTGTVEPESLDASSNLDASRSDAGAHDAGAQDAGTHDAGAHDAGSNDAGTIDSGSSDSGADSGVLPALNVQQVFATSVNGSRLELVRDVAVDKLGNIYVTGGTTSPDFPTTPGAYDRTFDGRGGSTGSFGVMDVMVMKFSPRGQLVWSTLLGGPNYDRAYAIEVDDTGHVYVAGRAGSGLPTTPGVVQPNFQGDNRVNSGYGPQDGFVAKLLPDGSGVVYVTYFADKGRGLIRDIAVDSQHNVHAVFSSAGNLDTLITPNAIQTTQRSASAPAYAVLSADGKSSLYGTYLGGSAVNSGHNPSVRLSPKGIHIVATEASTDVVVTSNAFQTSRRGANDFVVTHLDNQFRHVYTTYLGGSGGEGMETHSLAVNARGEAIIAADSSSSDYPTTSSVVQPNKLGSMWSGVITMLSADGSRLLYSTYFSNRNGFVAIEGVGIDDFGRVFVSGLTDTSTLQGIGAASVQQTLKGPLDGFFAALSPDLSAIEYASYFGSTGYDQIRTSTVGPGGEWVVGGHAERATGFPFHNAYDQTVTGNSRGKFAINAGFVGVFSIY